MTRIGCQLSVFRNPTNIFSVTSVSSVVKTILNFKQQIPRGLRPLVMTRIGCQLSVFRNPTNIFSVTSVSSVVKTILNFKQQIPRGLRPLVMTRIGCQLSVFRNPTNIFSVTSVSSVVKTILNFKQQIPRGLTAARDDKNRLSVVGFQKSNQHLFRDLSVLSGENDFEFQTADPSRPDGRS